jgi:uncharacterized membrane protein YedE/YeeE
MIEPNWTQALLGGALLGGSLTLLFSSTGRSEGVSGLFGGFLVERGPSYRLTFVLGLLAAALLASSFWPASFGTPVTTSLGVLLLAGFLVGFGTRMGSGCTSGHGIAGLARFSRRSLVATLAFIASGASTVLASRAWAVQP